MLISFPQSHPFELLNELTKQQIDTAEYRATCCMIVADRLKRHSTMPSEQVTNWHTP